MRNITVAVPDEVYRRARIAAAERNTSVSAMVAEFLGGLAPEGDVFDRLLAQQEEVLAGIRRFRASDRLGRDELHGRAVR
jgi:hypothetical protein